MAALFFSLIGLLSIWIALRNPLAVRYGQLANATVTQIRVDQDKHGPFYALEYSYSIDGQGFADSQQVTCDEASAARVGEVLPVRSLKILSLRISTPVGPGHTASRARVWVAGAVAAFTFLIAYAIFSTQHRHKVLLRDGDVVLGVIAYKKFKGSRQGRASYAYDLGYEFEPPGLNRSQGKIVGVPSDAIERLGIGIGSHIVILYDPRCPRRSVPYALAEYEVAA